MLLGIRKIIVENCAYLDSVDEVDEDEALEAVLDSMAPTISRQSPLIG